MRVDVWSALPPAPTGVADYVAETLPEIAARAEVVCRVEDPKGVRASIRGELDVRGAGRPGEAAVDVFHVGNSPAQGFVWRAARRFPGVVVLHEWCLADVVRHETLGCGDGRTWRREMRLGRGAEGAFFARLAEQGLAGELLPLCFPSNEPLILGARGVVSLSRGVAHRVRGLRAQVPLLALAQHVVVPSGLPDRREARAMLGVPEDRFLIVAPGLVTPAKRVRATIEALARLVGAGVNASLLVAGEAGEGAEVRSVAEEAGMASHVRATGRVSGEVFDAALVAADVVVALRFPSHGETSAAALRAMGFGACVLLTAGSEAALEVPRGTCMTVTPGPGEADELAALLVALAGRPEWRRTMGWTAREHIARHHSLKETVGRLVAFLESVAQSTSARPVQLDSASTGGRREGGDGPTMAGELIEEARLAALDSGLDPFPLSLDDAVFSLLGGPA